MRRAALVLMLAVAACGGPSADRDAIRAEAHALFPNAEPDAVDRAVDVYARACERDDDVFRLSVALNIDEGNDTALALMQAGCPDRVIEAIEFIGG